MTDPLRCKTAIVGIGATEFSDNSGRSEQRLAMEAILKALDDAGLSPDDVDGFIGGDFETTNQVDVVNALGMRNIRSFACVSHAGGVPCGSIAHGAMMVYSGAADCVVAYRSMNGRSGQRFGTSDGAVSGFGGMFQFHCPYGLMVPAEWTAIMARRRLIEFGETREQWASVPLTSRKYANQNPKAKFHAKKLTLDDYLNAPILADPLCKFDYCVEIDGATAFVITSAERARTLKSTPAYIHTASQGMGFPVLYITNYYRESLTTAYEMAAVAKELWKKSGLSPKHIDVAQIYDHFTPWVLSAVEDLGFCKKGEAGAFYADGQAELDGELPINTSGGMMAEAYMHGWSQVNEGVRQIRGTSTAQVKDCEFSLVASAAGCPTAAVILSRNPQ